MRRYADPVDVRTGSDEEQAPTAFLWRGRLYIVRAVLGHWRERRSWWSSPAARMIHGEGGGEPEGEPHDVRAGAGVRVAELAEEREVWRVSAAPGRSFSGGVYDLCRERADAATASRGSPADVWRLVRVAD